MQEETSAIVVNTGPLIALTACNQLDLLNLLHSRVLVPQPVVAEIDRGQQAPNALDVPLPEWMEAVTLRAPLSPLLRAVLDEGEAAAEVGCDLVAIDERRGRAVARLEGLRVTGSVGILLRAKRQGILLEVKPCLNSMREHGVWLSERLLAFALTEAGER
jgi:predicted nucleic acid-binding protein